MLDNHGRREPVSRRSTQPDRDTGTGRSRGRGRIPGLRSDATLAAAAANAGTKVGLEFLPWSNVKTVHDGLRIVRDADSAAGGLIVDVWHTERAHTPPAELAAVPLRFIVGVELNDADAEPIGTLFEDTVNRRRLCGEGAFDLVGLIAALRAAGWHGPWGVEILSEQHRKAPLRQAVAEAFRTAQAQLDRAR